MLFAPTLTGARECPVPEPRLNDVWRRAYEAYQRDDCINYLEYSSRYYELVNLSVFTWDTLEIGRAFGYCKRRLIGLVEENERLRSEIMALRITGNMDFSSEHFAVTEPKPPLRERPPHQLP